MNIYVPSKPFDAEAYCRMQAERRKRLMSPQNAFRPPPMSSSPEIAVRIVRLPMWRKSPIQFDHHIIAWQWHLAQAQTSRYVVYLKRRCAEIGADYDAIVGKSRVRSLTGLRQLLMFEVVKLFGLTWSQAGRIFNRDHAVVIHAVKRIAELLGESIPEPTSAEMRLVGNVDLKTKVKRDYEITRLSIEDISKRYSISRDVIKTVAKMENWGRPDGTAVFVKVRVDTRICMADVQRDFERGDSFNRIGIRYGISDKSVRRLADRNGWERKVQE